MTEPQPDKLSMKHTANDTAALWHNDCVEIFIPLNAIKKVSKLGTTPCTSHNRLPPEDMHGNPSLVVDDAGYIHVWYGGDGRITSERVYARSKRPEDIAEWIYPPFDTRLTYPMASVMSNVLHRRGNHSMPGSAPWIFRRSTDYGATWKRTAGGKHEIFQFPVSPTGNHGPNHFARAVLSKNTSGRTLCPQITRMGRREKPPSRARLDVYELHLFITVAVFERQFPCYVFKNRSSWFRFPLRNSLSPRRKR